MGLPIATTSLWRGGKAPISPPHGVVISAATQSEHAVWLVQRGSPTKSLVFTWSLTLVASSAAAPSVTGLPASMASSLRFSASARASIPPWYIQSRRSLFLQAGNADDGSHDLQRADPSMPPRCSRLPMGSAGLHQHVLHMRSACRNMRRHGRIPCPGTMQPWTMPNPCLVQPLQAFPAGRWPKVYPVCVVPAPSLYTCLGQWQAARPGPCCSHLLPCSQHASRQCLCRLHTATVCLWLLCPCCARITRIAGSLQPSLPHKQNAPAPTCVRQSTGPLPCHSHLLAGCRLH